MWDIRPQHRRSSLAPLLFAALAMGGVLRPQGNTFVPYKAPEPDAERLARRARQAELERETLAAAQARREKREARRLADRERTAREFRRTT